VLEETRQLYDNTFLLFKGRGSLFFVMQYPIAVYLVSLMALFRFYQLKGGSIISLKVNETESCGVLVLMVERWQTLQLALQTFSPLALRVEFFVIAVWGAISWFVLVWVRSTSRILDFALKDLSFALLPFLLFSFLKRKGLKIVEKLIGFVDFYWR